MPQMKPLYWFYLYLFFILFIIIMNIYNYFMINLSKKMKLKWFKNKLFILWKW